jgi:hypothetical protein
MNLLIIAFPLLPLAALSGNKTRKKASVALPGIHFGGGCGGCDFRIAMPKGVNLIVASVRVVKC